MRVAQLRFAIPATELRNLSGKTYYKRLPTIIILIYSLTVQHKLKDVIMTNIERIIINPDICNGKPVIRGKRITAQTILEFLAAGESKESILKQYPTLEPEDIDAVLRFAAGMMENNYTIKQMV